jgi:hypothetical protein
MRWAALFEDLEAQFEAADAAELEAEVRDRTRAELARIDLAARLRSAVGSTLDVQVRSADRLRGTLASLGADWLLMQDADTGGAPSRELLVPLRAVLVLRGLGSASETAGASPGAAPGGSVAARLDLRSVLRGIARDRTPVRVTTDDGTQLGGVVGRVGADHLELPAEPRARSGPVVPFTGLALVQRLS